MLVDTIFDDLAVEVWSPLRKTARPSKRIRQAIYTKSSSQMALNLLATDEHGDTARSSSEVVLRREGLFGTESCERSSQHDELRGG
jgi:hypothetical protein